MLFERSRIAPLLARLAEDHNVFLGTSSWRFRGWCGTLYDEDRYLWGTHFSRRRFNDRCLEEYAAVFRTVEVDSTYYALPKIDRLLAMADQAPEGFRFSFKAPDDITVKHFPNLPAYGKKAGTANEFFLSEGLFAMGFLRHLERIREKVGMIVLEFSHFGEDDFGHGRDFVEALDGFLGSLPDEGWRIGVEVRNKNLLHPDYFAMLARHGAAHVYNQWTRMPSVTEQLGKLPARANAFLGARFLLTPGRTLDWARERFEPFHQIREIDESAREALVGLIRGAMDRRPESPAYLYVGNDLEGNALHTIADVLEEAALGD
ncbi:MAG: DUF72 domain-containing protein [Verrucomicrobiae bacterium]|nr:DUF72 domain-containing protein [Verrucomicrobiae bacterium]MCP5539872.1 DUF72 domain-containing protein [Akkermansiaceae bacterium]